MRPVSPALVGWLVVVLLGCGGPPPGPPDPTGCASEDHDRDGITACTDCDDADPAVYPGAVERWYDGVDGDCDGSDDFDQDGDGDSAVDHGGADCDDLNPGLSGLDLDGDGTSGCAGDCADEDAAVHPGAPRVCNGKDDDCDGIGDCHPLGAYSYPASGVPELLPVGSTFGPSFHFPAGQSSGPLVQLGSDLGTAKNYLMASDWTGIQVTTDAVATFPGFMYDYADVTGDGIPDVVTLTDNFSGPDPIRVYPGPHAGVYEAADAGIMLSPVTGYQGGMHVFDHDGDGRFGVLGLVEDMAPLNFGTPHDRAIYFVDSMMDGGGIESVASVLYTDTPDGIIKVIDGTTDMSGDGRSDLILADNEVYTTYLLAGDALDGVVEVAGGASATVTNCFDGTPIRDMNGDGYAELRCASAGIKTILFGPLDGDRDGIADADISVTGFVSRPYSPGDIDGDGQADLLIADEALWLLYGPFPSGTLIDRAVAVPDATFDTIDSVPHAVPLGDSNGDGYADFLVGGGGAYYLVHGGPSDAY